MKNPGVPQGLRKDSFLIRAPELIRTVFEGGARLKRRYLACGMGKVGHTHSPVGEGEEVEEEVPYRDRRVHKGEASTERNQQPAWPPEGQQG